ncbi:MAG: hypothetical protein R3B96_22225 [Pirellulaceae bacterium]
MSKTACWSNRRSIKSRRPAQSSLQQARDTIESQDLDAIKEAGQATVAESGKVFGETGAVGGARDRVVREQHLRRRAGLLIATEKPPRWLAVD